VGEANENAIKIARFFSGRHKIMARYRSYHGRLRAASLYRAIAALGSGTRDSGRRPLLDPVPPGGSFFWGELAGLFVGAR